MTPKAQEASPEHPPPMFSLQDAREAEMSLLYTVVCHGCCGEEKEWDAV